MIEKTVFIQPNPRKKHYEPKECKRPSQDLEEEIVVWKYASNQKKGSAIKVSRCFMKRTTLESHKSRYPYNNHKLVHIERNGRDFFCTVPFLEGYIRRGILWLRERDDEKALELFRQNAQNRIKELEKLIEGRKRFLEEAHVEASNAYRQEQCQTRREDDIHEQRYGEPSALYESTFDCYKDYIENTKKFKDVIDNLNLFIAAYKKASKPTAKDAKRYLQEIDDILDKYTERSNHAD